MKKHREQGVVYDLESPTGKRVRRTLGPLELELLQAQGYKLISAVAYRNTSVPNAAVRHK